MKKLYPNNRYKVKTDTGWQDFAGVAMMGKKPTYELIFNHHELSIEVSPLHAFYDDQGTAITAQDLALGDVVATPTGLVELTDKQYYEDETDVFTLVEVDNGRRYFTNDLLSANCEFISDDETLIDSITLSSLKVKDPEFFTGQVRWYREPEPNKTYLVALDPSLGTGGDYSAIQVFQVPGMIQVAEWQHNKTPPRGQVKIMIGILNMINDEMLSSSDQEGEPSIFYTVENNTLGEAVLQVIEDTGSDMFPGTFVSEKKKAGATRRFRKGLNTDHTKKVNACVKLKSLVETGRLVVNSQALLKQLKMFVAKGSSFAGKAGEKDDLVMAMVLVVRMLDIVKNRLDDIEEFKEGVEDFDDPFAAPLPFLFS